MPHPTRRQCDPDFLAGPPSPLTQRLVREGIKTPEPPAPGRPLTDLERLMLGALKAVRDWDALYDSFPHALAMHLRDVIDLGERQS